jgi:hypothetical protein
MSVADALYNSIHHRTNVTAADTWAITLAERARLNALGKTTNPDGSHKGLPTLKVDQPNGLLATFGFTDIELMFWAIGAANGTFSAHIVGLPGVVEQLRRSTTPVAPALIPLASLNCILGSSGETNINPANNVAVTGAWKLIDTISIAIEGTGMHLWNVGNNQLCRIQFDPLGCSSCFVYLDTFSGPTRVECVARRIGSPK